MVEIGAAVVLWALWGLALWADETARCDERDRVSITILTAVEVVPAVMV